MNILYCVEYSLLESAKETWRSTYSKHSNWYDAEERDFFNFVGVTDQERANYHDEWTLKVPKVTYKKLELLAEGTNQHLLTLFKVIEARYK